MLNEQKQQARNLYFQTELTKTQIASMLNVSRRSISYWVKEGEWDRLRHSAAHMPALLAENCYHIFGHLTETYLSERRMTNPVTLREVETLHKLTLTIKNLKNRATLNENMESFGYFLNAVKQKNARLADELMPYIDEYMTAAASTNRCDYAPEHFTGIGGRIPWLPEDTTEEQLDNRENFFSDPDTIETYKMYDIPFPTEEEIATLPPPTPMPPPYDPTIENRRLADKFMEGCRERRQAKQEAHEETGASLLKDEEKLEEDVFKYVEETPPSRYDQLMAKINDLLPRLTIITDSPENEDDNATQTAPPTDLSQEDIGSHCATFAQESAPVSELCTTESIS
jgi:transposase-like protein